MNFLHLSEDALLPVSFSPNTHETTMNQAFTGTEYYYKIIDNLSVEIYNIFLTFPECLAYFEITG